MLHYTGQCVKLPLGTRATPPILGGEGPGSERSSVRALCRSFHSKLRSSYKYGGVGESIVCTVNVSVSIAMGIPKLTRFIHDFFTGWKEGEITGYLVIDGCSLCYHLYTFDWIHGGQYTEYRDRIVEYFKALRSSAIKPIVVFDGTDYTGEKSETILNRYDSKIKKICNQYNNRVPEPKLASTIQVLPFLAPVVFQETLSELCVECIMVDGEADKDIAQVANFYSCPVLSSDSDFYMFTLKGGFIHVDRFKWKAQPIRAEVYHVTAFMDQFNLAHESLRFIIPAIFGNDFLPSVDVKCSLYFKHIKQVTSPTIGKHCPVLPSVEVHASHVLPVVDYASYYKNLEDFVTRIESIEYCKLNNAWKDTLQKSCIKAEQMYNLQDVSSLDDLWSNTELLIKNEHTFPGWLLNQIRSCKFTDEMLAAICFCRCSLPITVSMGNPNKPNSLHISRSLRQAVYSLLELGGVTEETFDGFTDDHVLVEVHVGTIICEGELITRDVIPTLQISKKKKIFYFFLHCNADLIELLDEKWRLVVASVIFWARGANIPLVVIKILILTFVLCSRRNDQFLRYQSVEVNQTFLKSSLWWEGLHSFTQWQSAYKDAGHLSHILQSPLQFYSPAHIFDGKLAMYFLSIKDDLSLVVSRLPDLDRQLYDLLLITILLHKPTLCTIKMTDHETHTDRMYYVIH